MNHYYLAGIMATISAFSLQASEGQNKKRKKEKKTIIDIVVDEQKKQDSGKKELKRLFAAEGVAVIAILPKPEGDSFNTQGVSADDLFDLLTGKDDASFSKNLDLDKKSDNK